MATGPAFLSLSPMNGDERSRVYRFNLDDASLSRTRQIARLTALPPLHGHISRS